MGAGVGTEIHHDVGEAREYVRRIGPCDPEARCRLNSDALIRATLDVRRVHRVGSVRVILCPRRATVGRTREFPRSAALIRGVTTIESPFP